MMVGYGLGFQQSSQHLMEGAGDGWQEIHG